MCITSAPTPPPISLIGFDLSYILRSATRYSIQLRSSHLPKSPVKQLQLESPAHIQ